MWLLASDKGATKLILQRTGNGIAQAFESWWGCKNFADCSFSSMATQARPWHTLQNRYVLPLTNANIRIGDWVRYNKHKCQVRDWVRLNRHKYLIPDWIRFDKRKDLIPDWLRSSKRPSPKTRRKFRGATDEGSPKQRYYNITRSVDFAGISINIRITATAFEAQFGL